MPKSPFLSLDPWHSYTMARRTAQSAHYDAIANKARAMLASNPGISIVELANNCGCSPGFLNSRDIYASGGGGADPEVPENSLAVQHYTGEEAGGKHPLSQIDHPLRPQAEKHIENAMVLLQYRFPYYAILLNSYTKVWGGAPTMGVDYEGRLFINPEWVLEHDVAGIAGVLAHEASHVYFGHHGRVGNRDRGVWNTAGDMEINPDLVSLGFPLPGDYQTPKKIDMEDGLLAETYYRRLKEQEEEEGDGEGEGGGGGDGDGGPGDDSDDSDGEGGGVCAGQCGLAARGGLDEDLQALAEEQGAHALGEDQVERAKENMTRQIEESMAKDPGSVPGHLKRAAEERRKGGQVDWRSRFMDAISAGMTRAQSIGVPRSTWRVLDQRREPITMVGRPRVLRKGKRKYAPNVTVVIDTSGSMGNADISSALDETMEMVSALGTVSVIACDAHAEHLGKFTHGTEPQLVGGGGTDMTIGIEKALGAPEPPDFVVVLTDGYTGWPESPPPDTNILVGLIHHPDYQPPLPPDWIETVDIPTDS